MKILAIHFDDNERPSDVSVTATDAEANHMAGALGKRVAAGRVHLTVAEAITLVKSFSTATNGPAADAYDCLAGNVFNPFWDGGAGAVSDR